MASWFRLLFRQLIQRCINVHIHVCRYWKWWGTYTWNVVVVISVLYFSPNHTYTLSVVKTSHRVHVCVYYTACMNLHRKFRFVIFKHLLLQFVTTASYCTASDKKFTIIANFVCNVVTPQVITYIAHSCETDRSHYSTVRLSLSGLGYTTGHANNEFVPDTLDNSRQDY